MVSPAVAAAVVTASLVAGCLGQAQAPKEGPTGGVSGPVTGVVTEAPKKGGDVVFDVRSAAFEDGAALPRRFAMPMAGGDNVSPPVSWAGVPEAARSFVVTMIDRHPQAKGFVHWAVVGISPNVRALEEGASPDWLPPGAHELVNGFGRAGYGGPQPPLGTGAHEYELTVWALDTQDVSLPPQPDAADIEAALAGHVLAKASTSAFFGR